MAADLDPLEQHLLQALRSLPSAERRGDAADATALWRAQVESRLIDHAARWLQSQQLGYYTIGSAGHESNAAVALALRPTDPALLHYRSGGFYLARSGQVGHDGVVDILLGMAAAAEEPIAGGRHKVFGHADLAVIPQTSTIASHLPRAVGVAFAVGRAAKLGVEIRWPADAVTVCSFGDASLNHAVAQAALNTAAHCAHQLLPLAVLRDRGVLERTIRHELVHVMADAALGKRPVWVREGAAIYFAGEPMIPGEPQQRPAFKPEPRPSCPDDNELLHPVSVGALSNAYARARTCFAKQIQSGRSWRDVR